MLECPLLSLASVVLWMFRLPDSWLAVALSFPDFCLVFPVVFRPLLLFLVSSLLQSLASRVTNSVGEIPGNVHHVVSGGGEVRGAMFWAVLVSFQSFVILNVETFGSLL